MITSYVVTENYWVICVLIIVYLFVTRSWLWYMCAHYCLFICHEVWVLVYVCSLLSIYLSPGLGFGICVLIIVYLFVPRSGFRYMCAHRCLFICHQVLALVGS